jgi:hypothetical protein
MTKGSEYEGSLYETICGTKVPDYENFHPLAPASGGHMERCQTVPYNWIPAFAGMTKDWSQGVTHSILE